ncbi:MAG: radical SAM protein [bacterium]|nr:radical SAM protein [bacterium]
MRISEMYRSIQGESTYAGRPCTFIRTAGCSLRCGYCDTEHALSFKAGEEMTLDAAIEQAAALGLDLVEVTGGEPLEQPETPELCRRLIERGALVLIETSGAFDVGVLPPGTIRIMDIKTPGSRMARRNRWENLGLLTSRDEIKFVLTSREDYDWAAELCRQHGLFELCPVHFSPTFGSVEPVELAQWILNDNLPARLQLQLHKYIWPPDARGV